MVVAHVGDANEQRDAAPELLEVAARMPSSLHDDSCKIEVAGGDRALFR
jgi:hypothetical protein